MPEIVVLLPAIAFAVKNELAKSAQQPQQDATPNWSFKSVKEDAPAATASLILWSVIALQMQTYMVCLLVE
mgnify:FL=1|jgi:hypothetical protein